MPSFDFAFDQPYRAAALPFGVTPATTRVDLADGELRIRFGPWSLTTPVTNVSGWERSGQYSFAKTAGPARLSLADRGVTFATNGRAGVCVRFTEPVRAIDPAGVIRHPGATVTVADPEGFITALEAAKATAVDL